MDIRKLDDAISVAPQLMPDELTEVARLGFRTVINNRPDHEHGPDQPTSAQVEAAAVAAGLQYRHLPVDGGWQSPEQIAAFAQLLADLPAPVLACCGSGARSTRLYQQAAAL